MARYKGGCKLRKLTAVTPPHLTFSICHNSSHVDVEKTKASEPPASMPGGLFALVSLTVISTSGWCAAKDQLLQPLNGVILSNFIFLPMPNSSQASFTKWRRQRRISIFCMKNFMFKA